jgi:hypothetical protein
MLKQLSAASPRVTRAGIILMIVTAGSLLLSGCSSASTSTGSTSNAGLTAGHARSGASGTIASVSGNTLQVQNASAQTAVTYTAATTISQTTPAAASAVTVGSCVFSFSGNAASTSATAATTIAVTATTTVGACTTGFGGGGPGGKGGTPPTGAPTGGPRPSGAPSGAPTGSGKTVRTMPVSGKVTAVTATAITVSTTSRSGAPSTEKIIIGSATAYTSTVAATAAALVVNQCVTARGSTDTSGNVAATSLTVSTPGASGCTSGFARPGVTGNE